MVSSLAVWLSVAMLSAYAEGSGETRRSFSEGGNSEC
jgi:hypothetical protein